MEQERISNAANEVKQETMYTVDLGFYYLTDVAFANVLPELEINHFSKMDKLIIRGNSIGDDGLLELVDCLYSAHNTKLRSLDLSETNIGDKGISGLIEAIRDCIFSINFVEIEGLRDVSQEMRGKLEACLRHATLQYEEWKKQDRLKDMVKAGKKRDHYDEIGLNYVGKPY